MAWTEAQIADLKRLWTAGHSTSRIGTVLGVSKNAVIGKAHRIKLPPRPSPIRYSSAPKKPKRALFPKRVPKIQIRLVFKPTRPRNGAPSCLWPTGDPGDVDFHFCGGKTVPGRPYCPEHCARAYLPRRADKSKAA
jgi:GcrA cell cycle regulator